MILHSPIDYRQLENSCRYFFMSSCVCCMHAADFLIYLTSGHLQRPVYRQSFPCDLPCHSRPVSRSVLHLVRLMLNLPLLDKALSCPFSGRFIMQITQPSPCSLCRSEIPSEPFQRVRHAGSPFHIPSTHSAPVHPVQLPNFCIKKVQHRVFTLCAVPHVKEKEEQ